MNEPFHKTRQRVREPGLRDKKVAPGTGRRLPIVGEHVAREHYYRRATRAVVLLQQPGEGKPVVSSIQLDVSDNGGRSQFRGKALRIGCRSCLKSGVTLSLK